MHTEILLTHLLSRYEWISRLRINTMNETDYTSVFWYVCYTVTFEISYYIEWENHVAVGDIRRWSLMLSSGACCLLSCQDALLVVEPDNMTVHLSWFHGLYSYLLTFLFVTEYYISIRVPLGNLFLYYSLIWITSVFWKCTSVDSLKDWCQSFYLTDWVSGFAYLYWLKSVASFNWCQLLHLTDVSCFTLTDWDQLLHLMFNCITLLTWVSGFSLWLAASITD